MAQTHERFFQYKAAVVDTLENIITVPAGETWVMNLNICNRDTTEKTFSLAFAPSGAADSDVHYFFTDLAIAAGDSLERTSGVTAKPGDVIRWKSNSLRVNIQAWGVKVTA